MLIVTFGSRFVAELDGRRQDFESGHSYIFSQRGYLQIRQIAGNSITRAENLGPRYKPYSGQELAGKSLLVWQSGSGIGDLLFVTPGLKYLKTKYPDSRITLACNPTYHLMLAGSGVADTLVGWPLDAQLLDDHDWGAHFEGIIEHNPRSKYVCAYDLFVEALGLKGQIPARAPEMLPTVALDDQLNRLAGSQMRTMNPDNKPTIGLHLATSSPLRNWPMFNQLEFVSLALDRGWTVYLFGSPADRKLADQFPDRKGLFCLIDNCQILSQTVAWVNQMDVMVGPDSALIHIAAALQRPLVGLYGPFRSGLRMKYYQRAAAIDSAVRCQPRLAQYRCYAHGQDPCPHAGGPGDSPCMSVIRPEHVIEQVEYLLDRYRKN